MCADALSWPNLVTALSRFLARNQCLNSAYRQYHLPSRVISLPPHCERRSPTLGAGITHLESLSIASDKVPQHALSRRNHGFED